MTLARAVAALAACPIVGALAPSPAVAQAQPTPPRIAQTQPSTDKLRVGGEAASSWADGPTRILLVERAVTITSDDATLTADRAVVWLTPSPTGYDVRVALFGNAQAVRGDITRAGDQLYVTLATRPDVRLDVGDLAPSDRRTDVHYLAGAQLRRQAERGELPTPIDVTPGAATQESPLFGVSTTKPSTAPTTVPVHGLGPAKKGTLTYHADRADFATSPDGYVAIVMHGNVQIIEQKANGDRLEMQAQTGVIFTNWIEPRQMMDRSINVERDFDSVYLEDDIRMTMTPGNAKKPEQALRAKRAVYEFASDRAILTDAILHSYEPNASAPLVMRAQEMRKLGPDTYEADHGSITTSNFKVPSLAINSTKMTVRQTPASNEGTTTAFVAHDVVPRIFGVPVFYFPVVAGSITDGEIPLRQIQISQSSGFGEGIATDWGLFQTLGTIPPPGADASYRVEYYTNRGPALGFDTTYAGGSIDESTLQPFSFDGSLTAYGVIDDGQDRLGRNRRKPQFNNDFRGRVRWDHQQFLSDGWQVQAQAAYVSDPTFLEEWFRNEFRNGLGEDSTLLLKRTSGTEVFSILLDANLSGVPTISDDLQELTPTNSGNAFAPITVERLPEIQYDRLGDSFADDRLTFVSTNSLDALHFKRSYETLEGAFGFTKNNGNSSVDDRFTGLPSYGYTGYTNDYVARGDFRQEVALPLGDDRARITPFGVVRYTAYGESPDDDSARQRLLAGVGVRTSTQFSRTYDDVQSKLLDINRVRHIIEPQFSVFASGQTRDRNDFYIYDEGVDAISDVVAAQLAVNQRFQTKRGGEGYFRSVDFFTLNTGVDLFANEEREPRSAFTSADGFRSAKSFRGLYFEAEPEASIERSTAFANSVWRVTDTTSVVSDTAWNIDAQDLGTAALGFAVQRDPRVRYFAGLRYIGELNSTIATVNIDYQISERYSVAFNQSFNLSEGQSQSTSAEIVRRFEQFILRATVYFDRIDQEGGIQLTISPRNLPFGNAGISQGGASGRN